jgi:hypothetical protein
LSLVRTSIRDGEPPAGLPRLRTLPELVESLEERIPLRRDCRTVHYVAVVFARVVRRCIPMGDYPGRCVRI